MAENEVDTAERFWEGHYRRHERATSGRPNPVLADVVGALPPGTALDLGCGEGGDAVWLADRGWRVTAVDVSATALARTAARAATAGVGDRVAVRRHDLTRGLPAGSFDLVSAQYLHSPVELHRERVLHAAANRVAPSGLLLIVDHASTPPWSWADAGTRYPTPAETRDALDLDPGRWRTERLEAADRRAVGPDGGSAVVTDNVIALRRRAR